MAEAPDGLTVAVIGKDARTDALAAGLAASVKAARLVGISEFSAPGLVERCDSFYGDVSLTDLDAIAEIAERERPDLAVIGPEEPLAAGLVDRLELELGIPCFGPRAALARIESSKSWCRDLVGRYAIDSANPDYRVCRSSAEIQEIASLLGHFVVKPDGLTGGKGVKLSHLHFDLESEALEYAEEILAADGLVVLEEVLEGEEFSLQSITDGATVAHAPLVQDHKRAYDGDTGPNTGGMGSYSCADFSLPFLTSEDVSAAHSISEQVIRALKEETGVDYRGVLYGGFIATRDGVKLIEYNARFGDPEAMNVLPLLKTDLLDVCWNVANGQLSPTDVEFERRASVCKYVVPEGYPAQSKHAGEDIWIDRSTPSEADAQIFWAAVRKEGDRTLLTGSRALGCVGFGATLEEANASASSMLKQVHGPVFSRTDIGTAELVARRVEHMRQLRG